LNQPPPFLKSTLLLLAAGSGAAALTYEIVWFQLLELAIGSSAISLAVILATFMGGTCLGSLLFPRLAPTRVHPLRLYAAIEFGIGAAGLLMVYMIPIAGSVYSSWTGHGWSGFLLRGVVAAVCLLPPTILMGATLPALARQIDSNPDEISWLGFFYGANIAGAVFGCLVTGFYLLREYDVMAAASVAAAINAVIGGLAFVLATGAPRKNEPAVSPPAGGHRVAFSDAAVYIAIALSGFCALASETIWTRILGLLFGASVYSLAIIVAVFLAGLCIGSGIGSLLSRTLARPRLVLGGAQLLLAGAIAWTAYSLSASLPYWPINPSLTADIWFNFHLDLDRALWAVLPPTLLWGASFPLALAALGSKTRNSTELMARVYAANTLGAIAGVLAASLILAAGSGSQRAQQVVVGMSVVSTLVVFLSETRARIALSAAAVLWGAGMMWIVPPVPGLLIAHGRYAATWADRGEVLYAEEGLNASVAVSRFSDNVLTFHVAGKIQASSVPRDMRLQRMLGHLTTLTPLNPRSVLVIGCGAGVTAGAVSIDPRVERVALVEIEPLVPRAAEKYFGEYNHDVLRNAKIELHIDDGRHYLKKTEERFDAITADPLDPWVKGAANLYTKEFYESARQRLNPGGVITMYIQLFETNSEAVQSAVATFFDVFPDGTVWGNTHEGRGYDMVLLGSVDPLKIDLDELERRLSREDYAPVRESLREIGMESAVDLYGTYAGRGPDLKAWLNGASINRDRNLRMQYLAGLGLNLDDSAAIYASMLEHRRFPEDLFVSREGRVDALRAAITTP
jgi:spermidine synthase